MSQEDYVAFDLRDIMVMLRRRVILIGFCTVAGGVAAYGIASTLTRSYQASGEFVIKAEALVVPDPDRAFGGAAVNQAVVTTERDVLLATGMMQRVADAVQIPPTIFQKSWLRTKLTDLMDRVHQLSEEQHGIVGDVVNWLGISKLTAPAVEASDNMANRRAGLVKNSLSTFASKDSSLISVSSITPDPALSASIVNTLLDFYLQDRINLQNVVALNTESVLHKRLDDVRRSIRTLEDRIADASIKPGMLEGTEVPVQLRQMPIIGQRLAEAQANLSARQAEYDSLLKLRQAGQNDPSKTVGLVDAGGTSTSDLRRAYLTAVQNLTQLQARQGASYPGVIDARNQVRTLAAALSQEVTRLVEQRRAERDAAQTTVQGLTQQYDQLRASANARVSPGLSLDREREALASLRHNAQLIDDRLIDLAARPMDPNARILSYAKVPELANFPKKSWFAVAGGLLAMALAVGWIIVSYHLRKLRPSPGKQADGFRADLVGCIPMFGRSASARDRIFTALRRGADWAEPGSLAFQAIAVECEDIIQRHQLRVLAVTSGSHSEGKSTVVTGLALVLANLGSRVLVIDADMRRPNLLQLFGSNCRMLSSMPPAFQHLNVREDVSSGVHIAALPSAPSLKYLRSSDFADLLSFGRKFYDIVLCDTPPLLMVPDASIVAKQADGVLLIAENGRHDAAEMSEIARQILKSRTPVRGLVLTKLDTPTKVTELYASYSQPKVQGTRSLQAITLE